MAERTRIINKTYVISVSYEKGCYCHIKISAKKTIEDLSSAILEAFGFTDDSSHAFFMDNKKWSRTDCYNAEGEYYCRDTGNHKLGKVGLEKDKKFLYIFDFLKEFCFTCKVLQIISDPDETTKIVRSVGEAPEQYPEYYFDDEDEEYDDPYQDCRNEWGNIEPDDELYPEVKDMNKMYEMVSLHGVIVYDEAYYGKRIMSLFYDCTWNEEEGMGLRIALGNNVSEVKVVKIGDIGYVY